MRRQRRYLKEAKSAHSILYHSLVKVIGKDHRNRNFDWLAETWAIRSIIEALELEFKKEKKAA